MTSKSPQIADKKIQGSSRQVLGGPSGQARRHSRCLAGISRCFAAGLLLWGTQVSIPAQEAAKPEETPIQGRRDTPLLPGTKWHVHDPERPQPAVVTPGTFPTPERFGKAPSDAVVLFDGHDLSAWTDDEGHPAAWKVQDGAMTPSGGSIHTVQEFGDVQVHVEFAEPTPGEGHGQERGNSGVFLQGLYEVQVLDSYGNRTYPDGQAGAVYGQNPPQVNASKPPGEWQTYDIVFTAARFAPDETLKTPAYLTVFHNGLLVQDHVALLGPTVNGALAKYEFTPGVGPLSLQDHGNAVRYRSVWVRPISPAK